MKTYHLGLNRNGTGAENQARSITCQFSTVHYSGRLCIGWAITSSVGALRISTGSQEEKVSTNESEFLDRIKQLNAD